MVIKENYIFKDGMVGTKQYSNKLYKTIKVKDGDNIVDKNIMYRIVKINDKDTNPYDIAIDIKPYTYRELTELEMYELFKEKEIKKTDNIDENINE